MAIMKFKRYGKTITIDFYEPTTQEHNEFANQMSRFLSQRDDGSLDLKIVEYHAAVFDKWAKSITGCKIEDLTDRQKSIMLTRYMSIEEVDEKN